MSYYEYRVVPAPKSVPRVKGVKSPEGRYAVSVAEALNAEGRDGWEFQSTETIETEVKNGFFSKRKVEKLSVLVFRRWVETEAQIAPAPQVAEPRPEVQEPAPQEADPAPADTETRPFLTASRGDTTHGTVPPLAPPQRD